MSNIDIRLIGITDLDTDCVVNAANSKLLMGSGVCGAIFRAAGASELQTACDKIGFCPTGGAVITPGFALKAKYIVHAVGPVWRGGDHNEPQDLYNAYRESLDRAKENDCHSIGFPLISAGIFGYPKDKAWERAIQSCCDWIANNPDYDIDIVFAVLDESIFDLGIQTLKDLWSPLDKKEKEDIYMALARIKESEVYLDKIRGSLVGGAVGDALGYAIEFDTENEIFSRYGESGITEYEINKYTGTAVISDDTQMTLFTANGLLVGDTRGRMRGIQGTPKDYVAQAYMDWLRTQEMSFDASRKKRSESTDKSISWLLDVPELFKRRAPGNTCLAALNNHKPLNDYVADPVNNSKGCGGVMRVAPIALNYKDIQPYKLDYEGAQLAAITHGHSLGYMPAAILTHIINRIVFPKWDMSLKDIIREAEVTIESLFEGDKHLQELIDLIELAIELSENDAGDLDNIHRLGEGWVAEETLAISIYCALKYQDDFSAGIIASVNHKGDSDSTGAVTGNILGAIHGYDAIEEKWKNNLELLDVILELADDICHGCQMSEYSDYRDPEWVKKYIEMKRVSR